MIPCSQFDDLLQESMAGQLTSPQRAEFEGHLAECPDCVAILKGYLRASVTASAAYPASDEPVGPLPESLVRSVVAYVKKSAAGGNAASRTA